MDWEEDEGEEDDQEARKGHDHSPHREPGGDGPVLIAAHSNRPKPPSLKVLVLEIHHLSKRLQGGVGNRKLRNLRVIDPLSPCFERTAFLYVSSSEML